MTEPDVLAADEILRRLDIRYVIVGGQAIALNAATSTHDVDVMVATASFDEAIVRLRRSPALASDWQDDQLARFRILAEGGVPLDILNADIFAGNKTGEEFFAYLMKEGSTEADGILYATPELVWYTRLLTKRWKAYAEKIVTNVIDGISAGRLRKVEEIARRFGTEVTVKTRIAYVRGELARPDIRSLVKGEPKA